MTSQLATSSPRRTEPVVELEHVSIAAFDRHGARTELVDDVSFSVRAGETIAIIGESGSGKSMTVLAIAGLSPDSVGVSEGSIRLLGRDVTGLSARDWRQHRGRDVGLVFQDSINSLDPLFTVGNQIVEAIRANRKISRRDATEDCLRLLRGVGIPAPETRLKAYPHELSGGMAQRVAIAIALCNEPALLIADEPTTALDVTMQRKILSLIKAVQAERDCAVVLVSHDLATVANVADRVAVMYAGRVVEMGSVHDVVTRPRHPYTVGLLASQPKLRPRREMLQTIPGGIPPPGQWQPGCRFQPRCSVGADEPSCRTNLPSLATTDQQDHVSACLFWDRLTHPNRGSAPPDSDARSER